MAKGPLTSQRQRRALGSGCAGGCSFCPSQVENGPGRPPRATPGGSGSMRQDIPPPAAILPLRPGPWVSGSEEGSPGSCLNQTMGHRQVASSHRHQDVGVAATAPGHVAEAFHHLSRHLAGAALEALVGEHGHPQAEEEAEEGQQPHCLPSGGCLRVRDRSNKDTPPLGIHGGMDGLLSFGGPAA